ncbi:hypothetical protein HDU67_007080 [Dinochytrium kinnereticum]|nr:hypothetical protein HDU67_007080 [Dinochytrium kinnereticum]
MVFGRAVMRDGVSTVRERRGDADARGLVVKELVVRMLVKVLVKFEVVVLLDDAQWIDAASLGVMVSVSEQCPKFCCIVFTRPVDEGHVVNSIQFDETIKLNGLQYEEILNYFISRSGNKHVNPDVINADLVSAILQKTGGNLLQVDTVVKYLVEHTLMLEKIETQLEVNHWRSLDSLLSTKVETVIMAQFDRLDTFLQAVLKLASILGQYFLLDDILFLLEDETLDVDAVEEVIRRGDEFEFAEECYDTDSFDFFFRHISIRNAIYESIALAERKRLHLMVAERYERYLENNLDETMAVMPVMCYHFWRSSDVKKMVLTNLDLGCMLVDDKHYVDARNILYQVFDFIEAYESQDVEPPGAQATRPPISSFLTAERLASALSKVAWSSTNVKAYQRSQACAIRALKLSGINWPETDREARSAVLKALMTLIKLWIATRGGMVDIRHGKSVEWHTTVKNSLNAITVLSNFHGAFRGYHKILAVIWTFNHALLRCESDASSWFQTLVMFSYYLARSVPGSKVSKVLIKRCCRIRNRCDESAEAIFHIYGGMLLAFLDTPRESLEAAATALRYWTDRKLPVEQFKTYVMRFFANVMVGELDQQHKDITIGRIKETSRKDPLWTLANLATLQFEAFFTARIDRLEGWNQIAIPMAKPLPAVTRIAFNYIDGVAELLFDILGFSQCGSVRFLERVLVVLDQVATQPLLHNPLMVLFVTLALYIGVCALKAKTLVEPLLENQLHQLSNSISAAEKTIKKYASLMLFTQIGCRLVQACGVICDAEMRSANVGRRRKATVGWFKALLDRPKFVGRFGQGGDYVMLGGICCGVIGTLSMDDRKRYAGRAASLFRDIGAIQMERWASGSWI